jgi:ABC-2 type transport system permease protein
MGNTIKIAKKEFSDLLNSNVIIIVVLAFTFLILLNIQGFSANLTDQLSRGIIQQSDAVEFTLRFILSNVTYYACFIGVMIGVSCIAIEKHNSALSVLITKPVYRDTIINGKLIGIFAFLLMLFSLVIILYVSGTLIVSGNVIGPHISDFLLRIPLVLLLIIILTIIYISLSILISTLVKSQAVAMILGVFTIPVSEFIRGDNFGVAFAYILNRNLGWDFASTSNFICGLSPMGILSQMAFSSGAHGILNPMLGINDIVSDYGGDLFKLVLAAAIFVVLGYIAFLHTDVK